MKIIFGTSRKIIETLYAYMNIRKLFLTFLIKITWENKWKRVKNNFLCSHNLCTKFTITI